MTPTDTAPALPPLPEPDLEDVPYEWCGQNATHPAVWAESKMRAYALQSIASDRAAREGAIMEALTPMIQANAARAEAAAQPGWVLAGWLADEGGSMRAFFRASEKEQLDAFVAECQPLSVTPLYAATTPPSARETEREAVIAFMLGEGALDGVWFGDLHPTLKGAFWWRKQLRAALAARPSAPKT